MIQNPKIVDMVCLRFLLGFGVVLSKVQNRLEIERRMCLVVKESNKK